MKKFEPTTEDFEKAEGAMTDDQKILSEQREEKENTPISLENLQSQFDVLRGTVVRDSGAKENRYQSLILKLEEYAGTIKDTIQSEQQRFKELRTKLGMSSTSEESNFVTFLTQQLRGVDALHRNVVIENNGGESNNEVSLEKNENLMQYANEAGRTVQIFVNEMIDRKRGNMNSIIEDRLLNSLHDGGIDFLDLKSVNGSVDMEQFTNALLKVSEGVEGIGQVPSAGGVRENEKSLTRLQVIVQNIHEAAEKMKKSLKEEDVTAIEGVNRLIEASDRARLYVSKRRITLNRYMN